MLDYRVDHDSPLPVYYQIAVDLRRRIAGGEWRTGSRLPSEPALAEQYAVSRMTLRQAVLELSKEGILARRRGQGTFVRQGFVDITAPPQESASQATACPEHAHLRQQVWSELRQVARPDARFHWNFSEFVPDFVGSELCAQAIREHKWYREAQFLFVAPDNSLTQIRANALQDDKQLLVATHAIRRGFFLLQSENVPPALIPFAATLDGMEQYGQSITLDEIRELGPLDLLLTGVSVVATNGVRFGKGHGFFDLEWAMFRELGAAQEETPIIAVGHDCQLIDTELEPSVVDTITDLIVTPTRVLQVEKQYDKPRGILWEFVSEELRHQVPPLQTLYQERNRSTLSEETQHE